MNPMCPPVHVKQEGAERSCMQKGRTNVMDGMGENIRPALSTDVSFPFIGTSR
jgi:hypothetical protein